MVKQSRFEQEKKYRHFTTSRRSDRGVLSLKGVISSHQRKVTKTATKPIWVQKKKRKKRRGGGSTDSVGGIGEI